MKKLVATLLLVGILLGYSLAPAPRIMVEGPEFLSIGNRVVFAAGEIDIGAAAINRGSEWTQGGRTTILKNNPANAAGIITSVEIWAFWLDSLTNCVVGTFYTTDGNTLKCRDSEAIGNVAGGSKQTFSGLSIDVEIGDYIGLYATAGKMEWDGSGGAGIWNYVGEAIDPGDEATYSSYAEDIMSLYGTGDELTAPDPPTNAAATDGAHTDKVVITWTKSTGATKYEVFRDDVGLGELGDVATYDDSGADAPTITAGNSVASDGTETAHIALSLSGTSTDNGTTHTYKVKAGNAIGWSGDSDTDTGYRGVGSLEYQWQRSEADSDASYGNISGATSSTYDDTAAPAPTITAGNATATDGAYTDKVALSLTGTSSNDGVGRYYQCILTAIGASGQTSGSNRGYRGSGALSYQWQKSADDSDASYSNIEGATSSTYNDTDAPAGIITPGTASATDGAFVDYVTLSLTEESVADGVGRYYQCILSAPDAAGQTSGSNRGYRTTGALTYQWQRSAADSDADYSNIGGGTTDPYNDTGAPENGDGRYFKCVLDATGTIQQTSTIDRGYRAVVPLEAPTNFTLTYIGDYEMGIAWTKGASANNTMARAKYGSYPEDRDSGYLVYYGMGESVNDTSVSFDENASPLFVRAWSEDSEGNWSEDYAEANLEGFGMTTVAIALIVLVFTILAFWKRDAVLYMLGVIGWLFMTFYLVNRDYPAENEYLPFAIAGFCLSITLVMAIQALRTYFPSRIKPPTSSEVQAEHKRKVLSLTKRKERPWYEE